MAKNGRRRLYPMPVEPIIDHPDFIAMPAAARGILFGLLLHFWLTECRELPKSDRELRSIGRAHVPTWRHHKAAILSVFAAVRPDLERYWRERSRKAEDLRIAAWRANSNRSARAKATRLAESNAAPPAFSGEQIPVRAPNYETARERRQQSAKPRQRMHDRAR